MRPILLLCFLLLPCSAMAALSPAALRDVRLELPGGARLPLDLTAKDLSGKSLTLRTALAGERGFVVLADYTCKNLCGPALVLLGTAIAHSGLSPTQYRLIVIGLDPKDTADDARRMAAAQLPEAVRAQAVFLLPDARNISTLTNALGFRYAYDAAVDQFAHPEVVYSVKPDGRIVQLLSPLTMSAADVSHAFSDLPQSPGTLYDRFRVLCYRFGQLSGAYTATVELLLKISSVLTLAAMAGGLILMRKRRGTA